jgi:hypothetical protein
MSISSDMSIATPAFFQAQFGWENFFQPFTLSLCFSLPVKFISCNQ